MLSQTEALLRSLGEERRRVFADWRALILLRRATFELAQGERRWQQLPGSITELRPTLRQMISRGTIKPLLVSTTRVYSVSTPFAAVLPVDEYAILQEANPYTVFSHSTALIIHGYADELPQVLTVTVPRTAYEDFIPLGTTSEDWIGLALPPASRPARIGRLRVDWATVVPARLWGIGSYQPGGVPIRVTNPERTLLEAVQAPERSGGIPTVLGAWARAAETIDLDRLISYVERFDIGILRQRVGYILESLGLTHPALADWQAGAERGGSSRLLAGAAYSPVFSERWNLSINAPVGMLEHDE